MLNDKEWQELKKNEKILKQISEILRVEEKDIIKVTQRFIEELKEMEKKINSV